jgi:hypothetical protein
MYFILKIMVYKWTEVQASQGLWISKLGISNSKLSNLKVVLATHDTSLSSNQTAKQNRLFIKFLRENIREDLGEWSPLEGQTPHISRAEVKGPESQPKETKEGADETEDLLEEEEDPENEVIGDVYLRIFAKFQVNSMDSLLDLWKEQVFSVRQIFSHEVPPRNLLLDFLSHNPTLAKISQMTIVLNLSLSQFFSAIINSKNFIKIQEHYNPDYSKPKGWFSSTTKPQRNKLNTSTNFNVNFEEACILAYVYSVVKNISLDKRKAQQITLTKRTLRKAWFQLIGRPNPQLF